MLSLQKQMKKMMNEQQLWRRLTAVYDEREAKAVARWLLDVGFGLSLTDVLCGGIEQLEPAEQERLERLTARLCKGEPVQYVLGVADFCGRTLHVEPGVLIPRPETEELCRWAVAEGCGPRVLDIGTGSGCIAITLALDLKHAEVTAWDISVEALRIAAANAERLGADISFVRQDALCPPADTERWELIVSNPPYVMNKEREGMSPNVLDYEPHLALFVPDNDPWVFYRHIADYACRALCSKGSLMLETSPLLAETVSNYLSAVGFQQVEVRCDQFGKQRFIKATKP